MTTERLQDIEACVFDAYGTLFDVNAAAAHCQDALGEKWQPLAELWRGRQLQYTWLRSLMGKYVDFCRITADALDFAMASLKVEDDALRRQLLDLYMKLDCYPEVPETLRRLKAAGMKTAVLSNGSPEMLRAAADNAGITGDLDAIISVDALQIYKPKPEVYELAITKLNADAKRISFQSSNSWDAHGASTFGFNVVWVNRFGQAVERLPGKPDVELTSLHDFPAVVGAA